jgi:hypothetical protein
VVENEKINENKIKKIKSAANTLPSDNETACKPPYR